MPFDYGRTDTIKQLEANMDLSRSQAVTVPAIAAGTDQEVAVHLAPSGGSGTTLTRASIFAAAAITGAATNTATVRFRQYRAGALVGNVTGGSAYTTTASLAAQTEQNLFSGAFALQPGDVITLQTTHAGSGAALPTLTAVVEASPSV